MVLRSLFILISLTVTISCNNATKGEVSEKLSGSSGTVEIPSDNDTTLLTTNPTAFDFGAIVLNNTSSKIVTLSNSGGNDISLGSISLSGHASYAESNNCPASISPGETCEVTVSFTPTSSSTVSTLLIINYNSGSQKAISFLGRGGSNLVFNGIDSISGVGASSATLNWSAATGGSVSSYQVQRLVGSDWTVIATLSNLTTYYINNGLSPGTVYSWRVYALDSFGVPDGNTVVKTAATQTVAFEAIDPSDLIIDEQSTTNITLDCSDSGGNTPAYSLLSVSDSDAGCSLTGDQLSCTPANKTGHSDWSATINLRCSIDGVDIDYSPTLTVNDYSRPPVLTVPSDRVYPNPITPGVLVNLNSGATDADGDTITYSCTVQSVGQLATHKYYTPAGTNCDNLKAFKNSTADFNESTGTLTWTPSRDQILSYKFTITASDGYGGSAQDDFTVSAGVGFNPTASEAPILALDANFADSKTGPAVASQATTWADLGGSDIHATINGTGDNSSDHWQGDGSASSPNRLVLDGVNDYLEINADAITAQIDTYIFFRIPSSAPDGVHVIASVAELYGLAYVKGAGENRFYYTSYSDNTFNAYSAVDSIKTDTWYKLLLSDETGFNQVNDGRHVIRFYEGIGNAPQLTLVTNTRWDPQTGAGEHNFYLGHKPAALGFGTGPLASGTDLYGNLEIFSLRIYPRGYPSSNGGNDEYWASKMSSYVYEQFSSSDLGDTVLPSFSYALDPKNSQINGYSYLPLDEGTECNPTNFYFWNIVNDEIYNYDWRILAASGFSNPSCSSTTSGWLGNGTPLNPYRIAFDGIDDWLQNNYSNGYPRYFHFSPDTLANSFDLWIRSRDGENTEVAGGFGPAPFITYDNAAGNNRTAIALLDNGDGTSTVQLHFHNTNETVDITDTGITVTNDSWHHLALTASASGTIKLYKNGSLGYTNTNLLTDSTFIDDAACSSAGRRCYKLNFGGTISSRAGVFQNGYFSGDLGLYRAYHAHELSSDEVLFNCNNDKARFSGATCSP